jgi:ABC-type Fe3+ transport system permease subunit
LKGPELIDERRRDATSIRHKGKEDAMLNLKVWSTTVGLWTAISFTVCVMGGVLVPGLPIPHKTLEFLLPGFTWISPTTFILGLVESVFYGVYAAVLLVVLHNFFARRWETPRRASTGSRAA